MNVINTMIKDMLIIEPKIFKDNRGWFTESYNEETFQKLGINIVFKQDNHSYSIEKGVLRGLHIQIPPKSQSKLVRCTKGRIWDVAVDLRKSSPTYLKWVGLELSAENHKILFIPQGFAHGFITLENNCEVQYKVDNVYDCKYDRSIRYDDPTIDIKWPDIKIMLSQKDENAPFLIDSDVNVL